MANSTLLPPLTVISFFQWSRTAAPNPRLAAPINATATTLTFTSAPLDENGVNIATAFLMGVKNINSYVETILVPTGRLNYDAQTANYVVGDYLIGGTSAARAIIVRDTDNGATGSLDLVVLSGTFQNNELITTAAGGSATADGTLTTALSADGLTATGVVRGIDLMGLDWTTNNGFGAAHEQDSPVFCNITGVVEALKFAALQGTIATGGSGIIIGTDAAGTITLRRSTGIGTNVGFLRWNTATSAAEFSNDGAVWNRIDNVTGSNLVVVSAADTTPGNLDNKIVGGDGIATSILNPAGNEDLNLAVDLAATPGLEFTGGALRARVNATGGVIRDANGLGVDLTQADVVAGPLANVISDVTTTEAELDQALDGISANVTFTNLNTLTAGVASAADALHTHNNIATQSLTTGETINGAANPVPVALFADGWVAQIMSNINVNPNLGTTVNMGDADATTRLSQGFAFTNAAATSITLTNVILCLLKTGAPVDDTFVEIQTNAAGVPSGTVITDGTSNVINGAAISGANFNYLAYTFATPPTLVSGTTYHIVFRRSGANDAANYYQATREGGNNYADGTLARFRASTATWTADAADDLTFAINLTVNGGGRVVTTATSLHFIGFQTNNSVAGGTSTVQVTGVVTNLLLPAGTTAGNSIYLNGAGYTLTPTTNSVYIGTALSATSLLLAGSSKMRAGTTGTFTTSNGAAMATRTVFVNTGMRPQMIWIRSRFPSTAAGGVAGTLQTITASNVGGISIGALNTSYQTITAQSGVGSPATLSATNTTLSVSSVTENGFYLSYVQTGVIAGPIAWEVVNWVVIGN